MNSYLKLGLWLLFTGVCVIGGIIPEIAMHFIWHAVSPQTETGRVVLAIAFIAFGGSASVASAFIAFAVWAKVSAEM